MITVHRPIRLTLIPFQAQLRAGKKVLVTSKRPASMVVTEALVPDISDGPNTVSVHTTRASDKQREIHFLCMWIGVCFLYTILAPWLIKHLCIFPKRPNWKVKRHPKQLATALSTPRTRSWNQAMRLREATKMQEGPRGMLTSNLQPHSLSPSSSCVADSPSWPQFSSWP